MHLTAACTASIWEHSMLCHALLVGGMRSSNVSVTISMLAVRGSSGNQQAEHFRPTNAACMEVAVGGLLVSLMLAWCCR